MHKYSSYVIKKVKFYLKDKKNARDLKLSSIYYYYLENMGNNNFSTFDIFYVYNSLYKHIFYN